jgi:hypothetical protein
MFSALHPFDKFYVRGSVHLGNVFDWKSNEMRMDLYVLFISLNRAESVRVSQPESAPMDYPASHIP